MLKDNVAKYFLTGPTVLICLNLAVILAFLFHQLLRHIRNEFIWFALTLSLLFQIRLLDFAPNDTIWRFVGN